MSSEERLPDSTPGSSLESKMRRPHEGDGHDAAEPGRHGAEHQVERRRVWLRRQRQRVEHLAGNPAGSEDVARHVHVRQRLLNDERHPLQRRSPPTLTARLARRTNAATSSSRSRAT